MIKHKTYAEGLKEQAYWIDLMVKDFKRIKRLLKKWHK